MGSYTSMPWGSINLLHTNGDASIYEIRVEPNRAMNDRFSSSLYEHWHIMGGACELDRNGELEEYSEADSFDRYHNDDESVDGIIAGSEGFCAAVVVYR